MKTIEFKRELLKNCFISKIQKSGDKRIGIKELPSGLINQLSDYIKNKRPFSGGLNNYFEIPYGSGMYRVAVYYLLGSKWSYIDFYLSDKEELEFQIHTPD